MKFLVLLLLAATLFSGCVRVQDHYVQGPITQPTGGAYSGPSTKGNEQGNGADYYTEEDGSAWFLGGDKTIKYCYVLDSGFGLDKSQVEDNLTQAFAKWAHYIGAKHVNEKKSSNIQLTIQSEMMNSCDGSENIKFYFGVHDSTIDQYITKTNIAVAKRTQYDLYTGWGQGLVWVAPQGSIDRHEIYPTEGNFPDWQKSYNLLGILTHELGHIYGCNHVGGTIMDGEIYRSLTYPRDDVRAIQLGRIDSSQELYICEQCEINAKGALGHYLETVSTHVVDDGTTEAFEFLTGHKPHGGHEAVHSRLVGTFNSGLKLIVSDDKDTYEFVLGLEDSGLGSSVQSSEYVFKTVLGSKSDSTTGLSRDFRLHRGYSISGTITTLSGEMAQITVQRNLVSEMWSHPITISYLINGKAKQLFSADAGEVGE